MKNRILFTLSLFFGFLFINAGLDNFFHYMPMPADMSESLKETFAAITTVKWLSPLVGLVKLFVGIIFIIPKTRALGVIVILPVMIGILLTNIVTDTSGFSIAIVLLTINLWGYV